MQLFATAALFVATAKAQSGSESTAGCAFACLAIFDPVCGSDGETYGNDCEFRRKLCLSGDATLEIVSQGECPSGLSSSSSGTESCLQEFACLDVYTPVCGSDGETYSNQCELRRAQCSDASLTLASSGECDASISDSNSGMGESDAGVTSGSEGGACSSSVCTKEFIPVCGSDDVTYGNDCLFRNAQCGNASLALASDGECPTTATASASSSFSGSDAAITSSASASSQNDISNGGDGLRKSRTPFTMAMTALLAMLAL